MHSVQLTSKTFATFPLTRVRNIANTRFQWIKQPIATKQLAISSYIHSFGATSTIIVLNTEISLLSLFIPFTHRFKRNGGSYVVYVP